MPWSPGEWTNKSSSITNAIDLVFTDKSFVPFFHKADNTVNIQIELGYFNSLFIVLQRSTLSYIKGVINTNDRIRLTIRKKKQKNTAKSKREVSWSIYQY